MSRICHNDTNTDEKLEFKDPLKRRKIQLGVFLVLSLVFFFNNFNSIFPYRFDPLITQNLEPNWMENTDPSIENLNQYDLSLLDNNGSCISTLKLLCYYFSDAPTEKIIQIFLPYQFYEFDLDQLFPDNANQAIISGIYTIDNNEPENINHIMRIAGHIERSPILIVIQTDLESNNKFMLNLSIRISCDGDKNLTTNFQGEIQTSLFESNANFRKFWDFNQDYPLSDFFNWFILMLAAFLTLKQVNINKHEKFVEKLRKNLKAQFSAILPLKNDSEDKKTIIKWGNFSYLAGFTFLIFSLVSIPKDASQFLMIPLFIISVYAYWHFFTGHKPKGWVFFLLLIIIGPLLWLDIVIGNIDGWDLWVISVQDLPEFVINSRKMIFDSYKAPFILSTLLFFVIQAIGQYTILDDFYERTQGLNNKTKNIRNLVLFILYVFIFSLTILPFISLWIVLRYDNTVFARLSVLILQNIVDFIPNLFKLSSIIYFGFIFHQEIKGLQEESQKYPENHRGQQMAERKIFWVLGLLLCMVVVKIGIDYDLPFVEKDWFNLFLNPYFSENLVYGIADPVYEDYVLRLLPIQYSTHGLQNPEILFFSYFFFVTYAFYSISKLRKK